MEKKYSFDLKIETRNTIASDGKPNYIVRGYATIPEHAYAYKFYKNGVTFKEMFSKKGVENLARKAKSRTIFVDAVHELGTIYNTKALLANIQTRTGTDISTESNQILDMIKHSEIPIAKLHDIGLDEKGVWVDTRLNPSFRDVDDHHKKYFDAVWNSLKDGYLNKFSINFKPLEISNSIINGEIIPQIDDVDIFGISYCQGAANDMSDITEVALRSAMELRNSIEEGKRMEEEKLKSENDELRKQLNDIKRQEAEKIESEKKAKEEAKAKELLEREQEITRQKEELEKQKREIEDRMKSTPKSVVVDEAKFSKPHTTVGDDAIKKVLELAPKVETPKSGSRMDKYGFYKSPHTRPNMDGKVGIGELVYAQASINAQELYSEDTRRMVKQSPSDNVVRERG